MIHTNILYGDYAVFICDDRKPVPPQAGDLPVDHQLFQRPAAAVSVQTDPVAFPPCSHTQRARIYCTTIHSKSIE